VPCKKCSTEPVISRRYSGEILCENCFFRSFEKNAIKELRNQVNQLVTNSNLNIKRIGIGLSGGKDSTVALKVLKIYCKERDTKIIGLSVDEGIENYRSQSLECAKEVCDDLDVELKVFSYKELIGMNLSELLVAKPPDASPCSPCGILRRRSLNQMARSSNVDCLILGHNLDDFSQTVLMNHARGDVSRLTRMAPHKYVQEGFIPRLLPLRRLPEQEIYLYAMLKNLKFHDGDCPYAGKAQRNFFRKMVMEMEEKQPGTRHSLVNGMEKIRKDSPQPEGLDPCPSCGEPSGGDGPCVFCREFGSFAV
tara:strand:+ start:10643 stop:11566 length:924 start_codon:yes stop_codon:yes gene_type:complete